MKIIGNGIGFGLKDLFNIPFKYYQKKGIIEIPIGAILGSISLLIKPLSAVINSISILIIALVMNF